MDTELLIEARHKLAAGRILAMRKMPYYSKVLLGMSPNERIGLGTFAVDERWRMYYDPQKCLDWTIEEIAAVWLHEAGHVMRGHAERFKNLEGHNHDTKTYNCAADAAINSDLRDIGVILPNPEKRYYAESTAENPKWRKGMTAEEMYYIARSGNGDFEIEKSGGSQDIMQGDAPDERKQSDEKTSEQDKKDDNTDDSKDKQNGEKESREGSDKDTKPEDVVDENAQDESENPDGEPSDSSSSDSDKESPLDDDSAADNEKQDGEKGDSDSNGEAEEKSDELGNSDSENTQNESGDSDPDSPSDSENESDGEGEKSDDASGNTQDESDGKPDCGSAVDGIPRDYESKDNNDGSMDKSSAEFIKKETAEAIIEFDKSRPGVVPGSLVRDAKNILDPQVDWRDEFAALIRHVSALQQGYSDYSYSRPSRRSGASAFILPAMRQPPAPEIAIVLDTSGSMDEKKELALGLAEMEEIITRTARFSQSRAVKIINCDAADNAAVVVQNLKDFVITGGGGTDMRVGIAAAARLKPRVDIIITVTDGFTPWPKEPPLDNLKAHYIVLLVSGKGRKSKSKNHQIPPWMKVIEVNMPDKRAWLRPSGL